MPDVAFLSASIPFLTPFLRNNWKVPEPACICLGSLSNFRCAAATDRRKSCYLLNFAKNSQFSGECPGETGSYLTAHYFQACWCLLSPHSAVGLPPKSKSFSTVTTVSGIMRMARLQLEC